MNHRIFVSISGFFAASGATLRRAARVVQQDSSEEGTLIAQINCTETAGDKSQNPAHKGGFGYNGEKVWGDSTMNFKKNLFLAAAFLSAATLWGGSLSPDLAKVAATQKVDVIV